MKKLFLLLFFLTVFFDVGAMRRSPAVERNLSSSDLFDVGAMRRSPAVERNLNSSDKICDICFGEINETSENYFVLFLVCGHIFHIECLKSAKKCPVCSQVSNID